MRSLNLVKSLIYVLMLGKMQKKLTLKSITLGNSNDVNDLILSEHLTYRDLLLEVFTSPVDLCEKSIYETEKVH